MPHPQCNGPEPAMKAFNLTQKLLMTLAVLVALTVAAATAYDGDSAAQDTARPATGMLVPF
jgi:hypothetical protein